MRASPLPCDIVLLCPDQRAPPVWRLLACRYAVDHIFHSECGVSAAAVLKLSTEEEVGENGLPSVNWPSDHLSLYVEFALSGDSWASIDEAGAQAGLSRWSQTIVHVTCSLLCSSSLTHTLQHRRGPI